MRRESVCILFALMSIFAAPQVYAGGDECFGKGEDCNTWIKETYLPDRKSAYDTMKSQVQGIVDQMAENGGQGEKAYFLRGAPSLVLDAVTFLDELENKTLFFMMCNDGRIQSWDDFFAEPDKILFSCPAGEIGNDENTGKELKLLCKVDKGACGIHYDNTHRGIGGGVGIGIMMVIPTPFLGACQRIYITGTYVEYFFPWLLLNSSRQMYQSSYLDEEYVREAAEYTPTELAVAALSHTRADLTTVQKVNAQEQADYGFSTRSSSMADALAQKVQTQIVKSTLDMLNFVQAHPDLSALSAHSSKGYARNFSTTTDIEFMEDEYKHVPHYAKDTHRFGTDLPNGVPPQSSAAYSSFQPVPIPGSKDQNQEKSNIGGIIHSRFLSTNGDENMLGKKMKKKYDRFTDTGGPRICIQNNKELKKTPENLDPHIEKKKDEEEMCIDLVGNRFPLLSDSFSLHDTDSFWRSVWMGGIDLFYALNWSEYSDASESDRYKFAATDTKLHTFFEDIDRLAFTYNPLASDMNFVGEVPQCQTLKDLPQFNVDYKKGNLHKPMWGAQNTAHIWGYAKGVWNFKGIPPLFAIPNGLSRYPQLYVRFS